MELHEIIRRIREAKDLTQENLADEIGVDKSTIVRYEKRGGMITIEKIEKIADVLGVTVSDLYAYKSNPSLLEEPLVAYQKINSSKQMSDAEKAYLEIVASIAPSILTRSEEPKDVLMHTISSLALDLYETSRAEFKKSKTSDRQ